MRPNELWTAALRLSWLGVGLLAGCPQLLSDDFETSLFHGGPDVGDRICSDPSCTPASGDAAAEPDPADVEGPGGDAGSDPLLTGGSGGATSSEPDASAAGGAAGAGGSAGSSGNAGQGGSAGAAGSAGSSGSGGQGGSSSAPDPCRVITLNDSTHESSGNCLDIHGWNDVVADTANGSSANNTYANGDVCLQGSIATSGWGAVYNFTFNNEQTWNATSYGVTGFELTTSGAAPPPAIEVIFSDTAGEDTCKTITPSGAVSVAFSEAHPDCLGSGRTPAPSSLTFLRLHIPVRASAYSFNFCLQLRALP